MVKIADKFHEFSVYNLLYTNQVISTIETVHIVFFIIQFYWDFPHKNENVNRRISFINAFFTRFTEIFGDRKYLYVHSSVYGSLMTLWLAYLSLASHVVSALKMCMASMLVAHEQLRRCQWISLLTHDKNIHTSFIFVGVPIRSPLKVALQLKIRQFIQKTTQRSGTCRFVKWWRALPPFELPRGQ